MSDYTQPPNANAPRHGEDSNINPPSSHQALPNHRAQALQSASPDLLAWAEAKQMHNPGQDGSFATGQMSMGTGAVSGGPVFLPRRDDTPLPPDELLGLKGTAFHVGSDAEKAKKEQKEREKTERRGIFGRHGKEEGDHAGGDGKRGSLAGLFHHRQHEKDAGGKETGKGEDSDSVR